MRVGPREFTSHTHYESTLGGLELSKRSNTIWLLLVLITVRFIWFFTIFAMQSVIRGTVSHHKVVLTLIRWYLLVALHRVSYSISLSSINQDLLVQETARIWLKLSPLNFRSTDVRIHPLILLKEMLWFHVALWTLRTRVYRILFSRTRLNGLLSIVELTLLIPFMPLMNGDLRRAPAHLRHALCTVAMYADYPHHFFIVSVARGRLTAETLDLI